MERNIKTYTLTEDSLILLSLAAEFHEPLKQSHHVTTNGLIICADSPLGDRWMKIFHQLVDTQEFTSIKRNTFSADNNKLGFHVIKKYDSPEHIMNFLCQDQFLSVLICNSYVPDELYEFADVIPIPFDRSFQTSDYLTEIANCKKFFRDHPYHLKAAIEQAATSEAFTKLRNDIQTSLLTEKLVVVSQIHLYWYRIIHSEQETKERNTILFGHVKDLLQRIENATVINDISSVFIPLFYRYLDSNTDLAYCQADQLEG